MAETPNEMVLDEGRLDEDVLGYERVVGEVVWPREPGPPSKVKRGSSIKAVLKAVLAAGPTGLTILDEFNIGIALEEGVAQYLRRPVRTKDSARRSRQATAKTMSTGGLLTVRRGIKPDGTIFVTFTLTTAGREAAEEETGQKPGQDLDELQNRPWLLNYGHCATSADDDRRMGAEAPFPAGAECFGFTSWPDEQTLINTSVGPNFDAQKVTVRVGSKIAPRDFVHSYRLRSSGADIQHQDSSEPQTVPIDDDALDADMKRTSLFLTENRVHPQPTEPGHVLAALEFLTARDLASVLQWLEVEGGPSAAEWSRDLMMDKGMTGVDLVHGLLRWMAANTWSGNALGARRTWAYMQVRRFAAIALQSVIDLDTMQIGGAMHRHKVLAVNNEAPDAEDGGSEED